ncbi:MAG: NAD-dependent malic enzyme [bacterium]|nr:NAD-dependent malic enzyme [bacterium]
MEHTPAGTVRVPTVHRGPRLLSHAMFNKSTAFSLEERKAFGLEGLLPPVVSTMAQQAVRSYQSIVRKTEPLERYIGLAALQDRNEHLFYRVLLDHLEEFLPIVYTPVVGEACQKYSHIFRHARGIWITPEHRGRIDEVLGAAPFEDVRLIVVTDNERILGLGDQGAGGMGIPIGKLALYTTAAGIHPATTLPISLDVGTDNKALLEDELYIGYRRPRLRGPEYDALVDEFVQAVQKCFPRALLQWEDFKKGTAFALLERYRETLPSFNDDIQGTAAVTVAALIAGTRVSGVPLKEQRIVILGAGAAGVGIGRLIRRTLQNAGVTGEKLANAVCCLDSKGLVVDDGSIRDMYKREMAWTPAQAEAFGLGAGQPRDLLSVVKALKPSVLIGTSGEPDTFTEDIVREAAKHVERPLIMPLSNPTSQSEAKPVDVIRWTDGRALVATGSPFAPVEHDGRTHVIGQGNNAFVFPGIGLGAIVSHAKVVTDGMLEAAAKALAEEVTPDDLATGSLYPRIGTLRRVTARVAGAVVAAALADDVAQRQLKPGEIPPAVRSAMWDPSYPELVPV